MKKVHRKDNLVASIIFLVGAYFVFDYIDSGKWKYIVPGLFVFISIGNFFMSFEKKTAHEKKYPPGTGAMIYLQGLKQFWKDSNKKK